MSIDRRERDSEARERCDEKPLAGPRSFDVYEDIAVHQRMENWFGRDMATELQSWAERFIAEFKLDIPEVVIGIDKLPSTSYGQFRMGHNGLGLRGEITLNVRYLDGKRAQWEVLGTLLHELLHGWQQAHGSSGKRNHHNREFREKAAQLGLLIDQKGLTGYAACGSFKSMLSRFGVEVPATASAIPTSRPRGDSKLKKWACQCPVAVRCAVQLEAQCLKCQALFERVKRPTER